MTENEDSEIQRQVAAERRRIGEEQYEAAGVGLIEELADAGFTVDAIYDLWDDGDDRLVPILLKWLPRVEYRLLAVDIIRTLAAPWARPHGTRALVKMLAGMDDTNDVEIDGWTIRDAIASNVLGVNTDYAIYDEILAFADNEKQGESRFGFLIALGKYAKKRDESAPVLRRLLNGADDSLAFAAAQAAVKLGLGIDAIPRLLDLQQRGSYSKCDIQKLLREIKVDQPRWSGPPRAR